VKKITLLGAICSSVEVGHISDFHYSSASLSIPSFLSPEYIVTPDSSIRTRCTHLRRLALPPPQAPTTKLLDEIPRAQISITASINSVGTALCQRGNLKGIVRPTLTHYRKLLTTSCISVAGLYEILLFGERCII
jgi:hypothetical protein